MEQRAVDKRIDNFLDKPVGAPLLFFGNWRQTGRAFLWGPEAALAIGAK